MTNKEIEHMWKVASNDPHHDFNWFDPVVVKFAKLVAEHEREACAKIAENRILHDKNEDIKKGYFHAQQSIAQAIRARGQE
jgi:hypothetical protein